jgi:alpha/beta superfamily hydrolase
VTFPSGDVSIKLEGVLHLPDREGPVPGTVVCHPYPPAGGAMTVPLVQAIARAVAEAGIAALRFNFRGVGASKGDFDNGQGEVEDVSGAFDWLFSRPDVDPHRIALVGYSFGALMAMFQATQDDRHSALALVGLPLRWNLPLPSCDKRPCLLVAGDRDQLCPLSDLRRLALQSRGGARVHIVPGADHFFFGYEAEVASAVRDFLQETLFATNA